MSKADHAVTVTTVAPDAAIAYCVDHGAGSPLIERIIFLGLLSGFFRAALVTVGAPPVGVQYNVGTGLEKVQPKEWLTERIVAHLSARADSLVVLEDSNSAPDDPYLRQQRHPPCLFHEATVLWPLVHATDCNQVEETMSWASGWREVVAFTMKPQQFRLTGDLSALPDDQLNQIANSTSTIVVDVFRGEGYLVCERIA